LQAPKVTCGTAYFNVRGANGGQGGQGGNGGSWASDTILYAGGGDGGVGGGGGAGGRIKLLTARPVSTYLGSFTHYVYGGTGGAGGSGGSGTPPGFNYPAGNAGSDGTLRTGDTGEATPDVVYQGKVRVEATGWVRRRLRTKL
jgi:hypothetical protein